MRVAWLNEHLLYWNGGVKYILEVCKRLKGKYKLDIFVTRASADNKRIFNQSGLEIHEFSKVAANKIIYWVLYPVFLVINYLKLKKLLESYDILISSSPTTNIISSWLNKKRIFIAFEVNSWLYSKDYIGGLPKIQKSIIKLGRPFAIQIDKIAMRKADVLVTLSNYPAHGIEIIYKLKPEIVYEGVDINLFTRKSDRNLAKKYAPFDIVFHVASYLSPTKGTSYIVQALPDVIKHIPSCRLLILNPLQEGEKRDRLMASARELGVSQYVEFLPPLKEEELPFYYSLAKVVVQPSLDENVHLPLIEGAACRVPGIAFSGRFSSEEIVDGETGFLVPRGDVQKLSQAIVQLLGNPELREHMGLRARKWVEKQFTWDNNAAMMSKLIDNMLDSANCQSDG